MEGRNRQDRGEPARCPLRRYFAVRFDCALRMFVTVAIVCALSWAGIGWIRPGMSDTAAQGTFLLVLAAGLAGPLVEPVLLHWFGTTPGKALFGLAVRCADGSKPTLEQARDRTWTRVWKWWRANSWWGGAPEMRRIWEEAQDGTPNDWQIPGEVYTQKDSRAWRCWACGMGILLMLALSVLWIGDGMTMPRRRNVQDGAALAANYNDYNQDTGLSLDGYGWYALQPDGSWQLKPGYQLQGDTIIYTDAGGSVGMMVTGGASDCGPPEPLELTQAGGVLTGVRWQATGGGFLYYERQAMVRSLIWSFAGAEPGLHFWNLPDWDVAALYNTGAELMLGGVRVRLQVEDAGPAPAGEEYGEGARLYRLTLTMTREQ